MIEQRLGSDRQPHGAARWQAWQQAWADLFTLARVRLLAVPLLVVLAGALLAVHAPLDYRIDVGVEEGYGGDLPLIGGFNTAEEDDHGSYRWTADRARITVPGLGHRDVMLRLSFFPIGPEALERGPREINLWLNDEQQLLATLPVRREGATYEVLVPAAWMPDGGLDLRIRTHTFVPLNPDDPRTLGTPMDAIQITAPGGLTPVAPDGGAVGLWLGTVLLWWLLVRWLLHASPRADWWATGFATGGALLVACAAFLDAGRWALGAQPALMATGFAVVLALVLRPVFVWGAARLGIALTPRTLGWLLLIVVLAFGLRYGGRLYPRSMWGDIGFHTNRFNEVTEGHIFLLSRNRGVDFPYPPGPYVLVAPFTLVNPDPPALLQLGAALLEGLSAPLIYMLLVRSLAHSALLRGRRAREGIPWAQRMGLLAASLYVFTAAGFMTTWWSFDTHIYTQFFTLLLITVGHEMGLRSLGVRAGWRGVWWLAGLITLCSLVFLGHFGFFINTVLLGSWLVLLAAVFAWRGQAWARRIRPPLLAGGVTAGVLAAVLFYSFFIPLFVAQAAAVSDGGLTGLAERAPVDRGYLLWTVWDAGFVQHFGFFPLAMLLPGVWRLWQQGGATRVLCAFIVGSLLVSSMFAVLPFITLSTQSTRWLMFSAWAVAIGAALGTDWLWRRGRVGRVAVVAMAGFVLWNTVVLWVGPMLWRIRPPEPF